MKRILIVVFAVTVLGCATTYKPPILSPTEFVGNVQGSREGLLKVTKQVLAMEGFQIQNSDDGSGTISTSFRQKRLNEQYCDCGTTLGLPYIKDKKTVTSVALGIVVDENKIIIKANIAGEYLKNVDAVQSIAFDCVSTGLLEKEIFEKVQSRINL